MKKINIITSVSYSIS